MELFDPKIEFAQSASMSTLLYAQSNSEIALLAIVYVADLDATTPT